MAEGARRMEKVRLVWQARWPVEAERSAHLDGDETLKPTSVLAREL